MWNVFDGGTVLHNCRNGVIFQIKFEFLFLNVTPFFIFFFCVNIYVMIERKCVWKKLHIYSREKKNQMNVVFHELVYNLQINYNFEIYICCWKKKHFKKHRKIIKPAILPYFFYNFFFSRLVRTLYVRFSVFINKPFFNDGLLFGDWFFFLFFLFSYNLSRRELGPDFYGILRRIFHSKFKKCFATGGK